MFKHILLPTDGSEMSEEAARIALELARSLQAKVTALHLIRPYALPISDGTFVYAEAFSPEEYKAATQSNAAAILGRVQARARELGVACESVHVTAGAIWDAIIKQAKARGCDLVVMASHGRKGLAGLVLGSETNKVLTHSSLPVLVTR